MHTKTVFILKYEDSGRLRIIRFKTDLARILGLHRNSLIKIQKEPMAFGDITVIPTKVE
jgi:hypothetical protein